MTLFSHINLPKFTSFPHFLTNQTPPRFPKPIIQIQNQNPNPPTMVSSPRTPSHHESTQFLFKKLKRFRHTFEPSFGVIGFLFLSIFVLFCFFYLNYRVVVKGLDQSERFISNGVKKVGFLEELGSVCDVFDGDWVWDESYPLYCATDCKYMDEGFRCDENGRPDLFYTKWRWQPKNCDLPRFDARLMLEKLRNKRLVFVGDSIGRNQWESMLCMLSSAVRGNDSIYEVNGNPITKHTGFLVFKFKEFNCTVEHYRAPFLVPQGRPPRGSPRKVRTTLKLDQMDWSSKKWRNADVLVFNTGHWWNFEKTIRGGCYFQEGAKVRMDMKVESAYRRSIETVVDWLHKEVNASKTQVFFRTFSPVHFRGGDWKTGGNCHRETLPDLGSSLVPSETWTQFRTVTDVISSTSLNTSDVPKVDLLNITGMTTRRKDGHSSIYYLGPNVAPTLLHRQDCSHWCLPGVPDAWNELLYALFLKREGARAWNSSVS